MEPSPAACYDKREAIGSHGGTALVVAKAISLITPSRHFSLHFLAFPLPVKPVSLGFDRGPMKG